MIHDTYIQCSTLQYIIVHYSTLQYIIVLVCKGGNKYSKRMTKNWQLNHGGIRPGTLERSSTNAGLAVDVLATSSKVEVWGETAVIHTLIKRKCGLEAVLVLSLAARRRHIQDKQPLIGANGSSFDVEFYSKIYTVSTTT